MFPLREIDYGTLNDWKLTLKHSSGNHYMGLDNVVVFGDEEVAIWVL